MKPKQEEKTKKATCRPTQRNWQQMNRKQRREMTRKIQSEELSLSVVHPDAAGIDIGNESHYVAVPPTRDSEPVCRFGCTTAELKEMAVWLKQCTIRSIAMQSTGVYWIAVYDLLEEAGFEVYLVNARETKNLPRRKSDVQESLGTKFTLEKPRENCVRACEKISVASDVFNGTIRWESCGPPVKIVCHPRLTSLRCLKAG